MAFCPLSQGQHLKKKDEKTGHGTNKSKSNNINNNNNNKDETTDRHPSKPKTNQK